MVAPRPCPGLGLYTMKLQVWIKVQTEQIAWSHVLTGTLSAGHSRQGRSGGSPASANFRGCLRTHCQQQVDGGAGWEAGKCQVIIFI